MLEKLDEKVLKDRSLFAKKIIDGFELHDYESIESEIYNEIGTFLKDEDPYYMGLLYSILIRIMIFKNEYAKVVEYTNIILDISGMVPEEYCGKYSPFSKDIIDELFLCYDKLIKDNDISAIWGKARILHFQNKYTEARELYEKGISIEPNNIMLLRMYGRLYEDESNYSKALDYLIKLKVLMPRI